MARCGSKWRALNQVARRVDHGQQAQEMHALAFNARSHGLGPFPKVPTGPGTDQIWQGPHDKHRRLGIVGQIGQGLGYFPHGVNRITSASKLQWSCSPWRTAPGQSSAPFPKSLPPCTLRRSTAACPSPDRLRPRIKTDLGILGKR